MDELAVAFAMRCDEQGLTYEAGLRAFEALSADLEQAAEDRAAVASREEDNDG
jgi:hypothetical protein